MDDLHPTRKGIFAMDSHGTRVATGSKDTTVAIASLRPTGIEHDRYVCVHACVMTFWGTYGNYLNHPI